MERHLKFSKDYNWSEKGQSAVLIEGVFDAEPEITKVERMAAKCISAEQEAAQRKAELNSLKPTAATAPVSVDDCASCIATPVDSVAHRFAAIDGSDANGAANSSAAVFASPKAMKRNSVISANPELANTLNKMFSAAAASNGISAGGAASAVPGSANKAFRRNSTIATPSKEGAAGGAVAEVVKEKKVSQSKLLNVSILATMHALIILFLSEIVCTQRGST